MKKILILFMFPIVTLGQFTTQEIDGIVRVIQERNALREIVDSLSCRIELADQLITSQNERISDLKILVDECDTVLIAQVKYSAHLRHEITVLNEKQKRLKRQRWIFGGFGLGIGAGIVYFLFGR
jgi:hypothetical protein